jgi:hypothetical protein
MTCKFCNKDSNLIKAHIIPAGFFKRLRHENLAPRLLTNTDGQHPKKAPLGVYDSTIVCRTCEDQFGPWDDYVQKLLQDEPLSGKKLFSGSQLSGYEGLQFNYTAIKLFFISLLWRASVSSHTFYQRISLGPFEKLTKEMIEKRNPGDPEEFSVILSKFNHQLGAAILDPHPEKWSGINYVRFYLSSYVAYIKVDKRKTPRPHSNLIISDRKPLHIISRNIERSNELPLMRNIVNR